MRPRPKGPPLSGGEGGGEPHGGAEEDEGGEGVGVHGAALALALALALPVTYPCSAIVKARASSSIPSVTGVCWSNTRRRVPRARDRLELP